MIRDENDVKGVVCDYLSQIGAFHFPVWQGKYSYKGISDRIAVVRGVTFFIELKRPKGKQRKEQIEFERDVTEKGGHYICVDLHEVTLDDLHEYINRTVKEYGRPKKNRRD